MDDDTLLCFEVAMHRMLSCALAALASLPLLPLIAHAQAAFTNPYLEWNLRTDVPRVPYDGATYTERYNNSFIYNSAPLMLGNNPSRLWYMYHMDKIYRAQQFGYQLPAGYYDPVSGEVMEPPPPVTPPRHGLLRSLFHRD